MNTPSISVVMSAYNAQRYLRESVDSILSQTFADFEFIIIDDGSKDQTLSILREYEKQDKRIRIISRPNKGLTLSLNEGLAAAKAPLIARMDADDVSLPDRFEKQIAYLNQHPEVVLLGASVELIDPYGVHIGDQPYPTDHETLLRRLLKGEGGCIPHPVTMYRADAVTKIGGYRSEYNNIEDLDLFLRLATIGRVANLPQQLLKYRRDTGSISHTKRENQFRLKKQVLIEAHQLHKLPVPDFDFSTAWRPKPAHEQIRIWGWRALKLRRVDAARGHAKELLRLKPFSLAAWKLWYCARRGH